MTVVIVCSALSLFLGGVGGVFAGAWLCREDLRIAQRGVDEARAMLADAGLWPPDAAASGPVPAAPTSDREEEKP